MNEAQSWLYAGISNVSYSGEAVDLGYGITLRSTYAHLFAAPMMAFSRAVDGKHHPAPWHAARGGFSYDIELELKIPINQELLGGLSAEETAWLVAALLRLINYVYLMVPVLSDHPFDLATAASQKPLLNPFEIEPRILGPSKETDTVISSATLSWLKSALPKTAELLSKSPQFNLALHAADACMIKGRVASALLMAWGALEELFAPSRAELRFRVSAYIASYLEPPGEERLKLFKTIADLYNARSKAAHTAQDAGVDALVHSFVILRNSLVRIIDEGVVPSQDKLDQMLFGVGIA